MKKLNMVLSLFVLVILLVSCAPVTGEAPPMQQPVDPSSLPAQENYYCTTPESDNGKSWKTDSWVCYDTRAYTIDVEILGDMSSNQTVNSVSHGSVYGGSYGTYGSYFSRTWTEGKGILPVMILDSNHEIPWIDTSLPYILKTVDLGAMGLPPGAKATFVCNHDVEVTSPVFSGQTLSTDRLSDELDDCRLKTKNYVP